MVLVWESMDEKGQGLCGKSLYVPLSVMVTRKLFIKIKCLKDKQL